VNGAADRVGGAILAFVASDWQLQEPPVNDADEFRKQAEEARQTAARCLKHEDQAFWLRLAEDWLKLAQKPDNSTQ
jgi:hypothetical protein